ncbi:hypothetical protein [Brucella pseudogrignonensis]|uniref:hypothetical protein n=1 Tax=Brucella pseudogrignonensis TaxID=419475 RepID=UPI0038D00739
MKPKNPISSENQHPMIIEDDDQIIIPEELFEHLPTEYRQAAEAAKSQASKMLELVDKDLGRLEQLINAIPTTTSLSYIFHRLRNVKFDRSAEAWMEQEMLTTAFVVTYARLFASGSRGSGVSRDSLPVHLRTIHDDIMDIRNKRYAHNSGHSSVASRLQIDFDGEQFRVQPQMSMGLYVGGRNEWEELVRFLDGLMHERLQKILKRLKEKTGKDWMIPSGPAPEWVGKY